MRSIGRTVSLLAFAALCSSCVTPPPRPDGAIGYITVRGANATLNRAPAMDHAWIFSGAHVATGPNTTLFVHFVDGGVIQLDENTDPDIFDKTWDAIVGGTCTIVRVAVGRVFLSGSNICIHYDTVALVMQSQVAIEVLPGRSSLVVLEGHVNVRTPVAASLTRNQGLFVAGGRATPRPLTPEEVRRAVEWRLRFRTALERSIDEAQWTTERQRTPTQPPDPTGWCCAGGASFPALKSVCDARHGGFYATSEQAVNACRVIR